MKISRRVVGMLTKVSFAALIVMSMAVQSQAQVSFNFNYTDGAGIGFNHATEGAARRAALESSASTLADYFANYTATIDIDVDGSETNNGILASAGSSYSSAFPGTGFGDQGDVMVKILGGADPSGGTDGNIVWNFEDHNWEYGTDFQPGEFDFVSTAIHELMHTVGFLSGIQQSGQDLWSTPIGDPSTWEPFDEFVADSAGALINGSHEIDETRWLAASEGGSSSTNGLFFIGANAMAANGGNAVNLYSPGTWEPGSSGSHLDDDAYSGTHMMESSAFAGLGVRALSDIEMGILKDIGYTNLVVAIPEPANVFALGTVGLVVLLRRRRG